MIYNLEEMRAFIRPCKAELRKHGYTDDQLNVDRIIDRAEVLFIGGHTGHEAAAIILDELESGVM
jgi:hypothetical protein